MFLSSLPSPGRCCCRCRQRRRRRHGAAHRRGGRPGSAEGGAGRQPRGAEGVARAGRCTAQWPGGSGEGAGQLDARGGIGQKTQGGCSQRCCQGGGGTAGCFGLVVEGIWGPTCQICGGIAGGQARIVTRGSSVCLSGGVSGWKNWSWMCVPFTMDSNGLIWELQLILCVKITQYTTTSNSDIPPRLVSAPLLSNMPCARIQMTSSRISLEVSWVPPAPSRMIGSLWKTWKTSQWWLKRSLPAISLIAPSVFWRIHPNLPWVWGWWASMLPSASWQWFCQCLATPQNFLWKLAIWTSRVTPIYTFFCQR